MTQRSETSEMPDKNDTNETHESATLNDIEDEIDKAGEGDYVMDLDTLETYFETMIVNTCEAYDLLAAFLVQLKTELELGPPGITPVSNTLDDGIDFAFRQSKAYRLSRELFLMSYRGVLQPQEEPERLIGPVLERARKEYEQDTAKWKRRRSKRPGKKKPQK
jgi:hypothetical protein